MRAKRDVHENEATHDLTQQCPPLWIIPRLSHTVRCRPTLTLVERFGNGSVRERSIYERSFTSEPSIEKYLAKPAYVNTIVYLGVIENPVEYQKLLWNVSEEGKETKGICLWAYSSKHTEVLLATSLCEG